ncbi:MAG: hypothetical protein JKY81_03650 [Colwellia sp.]|nr:hypothetical protein [Colwellia sp.]
MKYILSILCVFISLSLNATEVVYSMQGLENCKNVGSYNTSLRKRATKERIEKRLIKKGKANNVSHIYVSDFIDNRKSGKGIKVKAVGKVCA